MHRDVLPPFVLRSLVFGADRTPELDLVGAVPFALAVDPEADVLLTVVFDCRPLSDPGVAADDELLHTGYFAQCVLNDFGEDRGSSRK